MSSAKPRLFIITRHPGAQEWVRQRLAGLEPIVRSHLHDPSELHRGDVACGVLPLKLAAALCRRGVRVVCIDVDVPEGLRGRELDTQMLDHLGACLTRYEVKALPVRTVDDALKPDAAPPPRERRIDRLQAERSPENERRLHDAATRLLRFLAARRRQFLERLN